MSDKASGKQSIRTTLLALRDASDPGFRAEASARACFHAAAWLKNENCTSFAAYIPFRSELDVTTLIEWAWEEGLEVLAPRVQPAAGMMVMHVITSWDQLARGAYGIMEPDPAVCPELPAGAAPSAVLVPGSGFDRKGGRLGYGGGYYDRYRSGLLGAMAEGTQAPLWAGIGFALQIIADIPMESHDAVLSALITEEGVLSFDGVDQVQQSRSSKKEGG